MHKTQRQGSGRNPHTYYPMSDWSRPVFNSLPEDGYRNNPTVDALTLWLDEKLASKATQMQNLWRDLCDPLTCYPEYLDFLAYLVGLSGSYWDTKWSTDVKRQLIAASHTKLWTLKGTAQLLLFVMQVHGIDCDLWTDGALVLSFAMPATFGSAQLRFYLRLPLKYKTDSKEWIEAQRTLRNFAPAIVEHEVCYDAFYIGFSDLGQPMFS